MSIVVALSVLVLIFLAFKTSYVLGILAVLASIMYCIYTYMPIFWAVKAQKAFGKGDFNATVALYRKSVNTGRAKLNIKINYAYALMRTGEFDEAERILNPIIRTKHLKKEEFRKIAKSQRCMVYYKQGRMEEALEDAYELFNSGYKNTQMYGMIGYFKLINNDDIKETTQFCEEAYEYNSDDRDIMDNLSICYYKQGRYEEAEELSDKIIDESPKFVEAYYHGAQIAAKLGKNEKAKELLSHVDECRWSAMTTITKDEINQLRHEVE